MSTPEHMARMRRAAELARRRRAAESAARVQAYRAWLRAGSVLRDIPPVPSDADYAAARRIGAIEPRYVDGVTAAAA